MFKEDHKEPKDEKVGNKSQRDSAGPTRLITIMNNKVVGGHNKTGFMNKEGNSKRRKCY